MLSAFALIAANLVPLAGVIFFGWSMAGVVLGYWLESAVIGVYTLLKMHYAEGKSDPSAYVQALGKTYTPKDAGYKKRMMAFFAVHYGMFMAIHFFFLTFLFGSALEKNLGEAAVFIAFAIASHGISFKVNYLDGGECKRSSTSGLFKSPYARIIPMHAAIMLGAVLQQTGLVLILVKAAIDLASHANEHRKR